MAGKRWSIEDLNFLQENYKKYTQKEMSINLNRTEKSINLMATFLKLKKGKLNTNRKFIVNDTYFDFWSSNMSYILGYITADGYLFKDKTLKFDCSLQDKEILEFIKIEISPNSIIKIYQRKNKDYCTLLIHSTVLLKSLIKLGLKQCKSGQEIYPDIPENFRHDYLRGYFDGDGCIHTSIRNNKYKIYRYDFTIVCKSREFLEKLNSNILDNSCFVTKHNDIWRLYTAKKSNIIQIRDKFYSDNKFGLNRKKIKLQEIKDE